MTWFFILSCIVALGVGIYFGLPGRYDQSLDEVDKRLGEHGRHKKATRHFTVINLLHRKAAEKGSDRRRRRSRRKPFQI